MLLAGLSFHSSTCFHGPPCCWGNCQSWFQSITFKVFVLYPLILQVLNHESFLGISEVALKQIISRDSFCAAEVSVKQCWAPPLTFHRLTFFGPFLHGRRPIQALMCNQFLLRSDSAFSPSMTSWRWRQCLELDEDKLTHIKGCSANRADASGRPAGRDSVQDRIPGHRAPI